MRKTIVAAVLALGLGVTLSACGTAEPLPADAAGKMTAAAGEAAPAPAQDQEEAAAEKASTCDVAREALLTGNKKQIAKALKALQTDRTADADAREAAKSYLTEDNKDLKDMYESTITMYCEMAA